MPYLKKKSEQNEIAADLLKNKGLYASSIHCSYYSSLQFVKHLLLKIYKPENEIEDEIPGSRFNSHQYYIVKLTDELKAHREYFNDVRLFKEKIYDLKELRTNGDYKNIETPQTDCEKAEQLNKKILKILKKIFNDE